MKFFLLTNPRSLLTSRSGTAPDTKPNECHGSLCAIGPKRPAGLRRSPPRSKNCINAKKVKQNAIKRRRAQEKAALELQEQIWHLDRQLTLVNQRAVMARQNAQASALNLVKRYFDLVVRGFNPAKYPHQTQVTETYLRATFAKELKSPDYTGLDQFIEQWQLISECHENVECEVTSIEVCPHADDQNREEIGGNDFIERQVNVVQSQGRTTLQISRTTIERVFPHILTDEPLVQSLIGKTYSFSFTLIAYVDARDGRVFQIESKVDLTSALLDLLQDPFTTIKMMGATTMTKHGNLLLTDAVHEDQNVIENGFL